MPKAFVYVIGNLGRCKIGMSNSPHKRTRDLSNASGADLVLRAAKEFRSRRSARHVEKALHQRFHLSRGRGEWFTSDPHKVVLALQSMEDPGLQDDDEIWDVAV